MGTHVPMLNNIVFVHMKTPYVPNLVNIEFPQTWEQVFPHGNPMFSVGGIHSHGGGTHSNVDQYITQRKTPRLTLSFSPLKNVKF